VYTLDNDFLSVKSVDSTFLRKTDKLSMWTLDTDYDGKDFFQRQVFFSVWPAKRKAGRAWQRT